MAEQELLSFAERMDRCWLEGRFDDLRHFLSPDILVVAPNGARVGGIDAAIASYRGFMSRCEVLRFETRDKYLTERGDTAVLEYRWDMEWRDGEARHEASGRELLVLSRGVGGWRAVWRSQLPD